MPKSGLHAKFLQLRLSTVISFILCSTAVIFFFTSYGEYNYNHVNLSEINNGLYKAVNPSVVIKGLLKDCKYEHILKSKHSLNTWEVPLKFDDFSARGLSSGNFVPEDCTPLFSVAILVTYRNRQKQLDVFLPYIHNFLRKQNIHYRIYLIEQQDDKPWNKGLLYNIGARQAIADKYPCLILHDVDLIPLDESNLYACMENPRHLSASIDKFRFVLPYHTLVGGVLAITAKQFKTLNGFSNRFEGWGGEDDDMASRIAHNNMKILRFPREMSQYTMLIHNQETKNSKRLQIMTENKQHYGDDGLNSMDYKSIQVTTNPLFTLIGVKL